MSGDSRYAHLSKGALIALLERRDTTQKFGLVWEHPPEEVESALNEDFVALEPMSTLSCGSEPYANLIIEGENHDALRALRTTHQGKVRCIYIDPPYNTGNRDFVYNDRYIDREHRFRHSLWVEFMYRRLVLAKELLREDGIILVSIGEDEVASLLLLMDSLFGELKGPAERRWGRIGTFVWRSRGGAQDGKSMFSQDHEYVLAYSGPDFAFRGLAKNENLYKNPDADPRGPWKSDNLTAPKTFRERPGTFYPIRNPANDVWYPCNPDSVWRLASRARLRDGQVAKSDTMEQLIEEERILWPQDDHTVTFPTLAALQAAIAEGNVPKSRKGVPLIRADLPDLAFWVGKRIGFGRPQRKSFFSELKRDRKTISSWLRSTLDVSAVLGAIKTLNAPSASSGRVVGELGEQSLVVGQGKEGADVLTEVMAAKVFNYPKPPSLLAALLSQATRPDQQDIVLDFFAGSGTTGHVVAALNAADGGNRRFILVSNTEATAAEPKKNLCRDVCRVRVQRVMQGYVAQSREGSRDVAGLGGGFAYCVVRRAPRIQIGRRLQHRWVWAALSLRHTLSIHRLKDGAVLGHLPLTDCDILYIPDEHGVSADAVKAIRQILKRRTNAIIYSWTPGRVRDRFDLPGVTIKRIPDDLIALLPAHAD